MVERESHSETLQLPESVQVHPVEEVARAELLPAWEWKQWNSHGHERPYLVLIRALDKDLAIDRALLEVTDCQQIENQTGDSFVVSLFERLSGKTVRDLLKIEAVIHESSPHPLLTKREREVLKRMPDQPKVIAFGLGVNPSTVRSHQSAMKRKLGVETGLELIKESYRTGVHDIEPLTEEEWDGIAKLSSREHAVVNQLPKRMKEIAAQIDSPSQAVKSRFHQAYNKTNTFDKAELYQLMLRAFVDAFDRPNELFSKQNHSSVTPMSESSPTGPDHREFSRPGVLAEREVKDEIRGSGWQYSFKNDEDGQEVHTLWRRIKPESQDKLSLGWAASDRREVGFREEPDGKLSVSLRLSGVIDEDINVTRELNRQIDAAKDRAAVKEYKVRTEEAQQAQAEQSPE